MNTDMGRDPRDALHILAEAGRDLDAERHARTVRYIGRHRAVAASDHPTELIEAVAR